MNLKQKVKACSKPGRLAMRKRTYTRNEVIWFGETVAHNEIDETNVDYFFRVLFGIKDKEHFIQGKREGVAL